MRRQRPAIVAGRFAARIEWSRINRSELPRAPAVVCRAALALCAAHEISFISTDKIYR